MQIATYLSMATVATLYLSESVMILMNNEISELAGIVRALAVMPLGAISIVLGIGPRRLQDGMGRIAKVAGNLELAFGISYASLIFSFVGLLLLIPLLVVEVVLLSKADQLVKDGEI